ncbi:hypothetical protein NCER_101864 [Vairimorpha ceranae BRL01]|uniref:Uncharacterized protein n=2 Tax=Vairimorpha ceranae TaxID=40302 RepID=C4VAW8_VAIC1|nr:hypothetical protein NCER_101864 [Vairimorpha ceranae BRL01]
MKKIPYFFLSLICVLTLQTCFFIFVFQRQFMFKTFSYYKIPIYETYKKIDLFFIDKKSETDIVFCHGSIISGKTYKRLLDKMAENTGCNVISFNIRGMFNKRGVPSEKSIKKELNDLVEYFKARKNRNYIFFGQSLGCSLAIYLNNLIPGKCILENPFVDYKSTVKKLPIWKWFTFLIVDKWKNNTFGLDSVLFLLSTDDKLVENANGEQLALNCKNGIIRYLHGNTHFNSACNNNYYKFIKDFI